ncbi:UDP-N-acetylmuramoyl-tripeptide--D-alanyl-D-alanine ligase [Nonlabens marinus]|uniref:UDP-N-acetylmuramoyl-tripeptide--D-alanyl-D-alanine ligase n=1 Tax=Nonlabens marinus S1-08 TaxID=1454201 RepID=W8VQ50_9FLAO|nr:UDP-N-acetylmuramoyl-tripeptide--D-alanyl-D-alanine ligase [Nonlabens marinus]BAO55454.1 UDP-N-acetylmuramoylalanyl-D-glutamyl-2,6-diaminopimelate--D-alanyl-D-alanine ligase [Nonlabens marinus S1-08]
MNIESLYSSFKSSKGVHTDTRTLQPGQLYVALSGENFDGNAYVDAAFAKGASHVVCSDPGKASQENVTVVADTLKALQELATYHRNKLNLPIVGLTGSNGKTTTKELIIAVLSQKFQVKGTKGNLNNHIGVPLTLLSFDEQTQIGVVEMGANHIGEIAELCQIAQPNFGLITNFGKAHLEGFGSLEGVKRGKSELYDYLRANNGKAIVLSTDVEQLARSKDLERRVTPIMDLKSSQPIEFTFENETITTQLTGSYNFNNMELAAGVGLEFGLHAAEIGKGLSSYKPVNNRSQLIVRDSYTVIMDAYNANPTSMKAALENLALQDGFTVAILGDMFEMGSYAAPEHQEIVNHAEKLKINQVILLGHHFFETQSATVQKFKTFEDFLQNPPISSDLKATVLIKGSRGMALERVLEIL